MGTQLEKGIAVLEALSRTRAASPNAYAAPVFSILACKRQGIPCIEPATCSASPVRTSWCGRSRSYYANSVQHVVRHSPTAEDDMAPFAGERRGALQPADSPMLPALYLPRTLRHYLL